MHFYYQKTHNKSEWIKAQADDYSEIKKTVALHASIYFLGILPRRRPEKYDFQTIKERHNKNQPMINRLNKSS